MPGDAEVLVNADGIPRRRNPLSESEHSVMDGDWNEGQKEEDHIADGFLPVGRNGQRHELASDGVHFMGHADQDVCGDHHVQHRVVGNENQNAMRVGRQPDVILT